jgi:hypothetical protein
MRFDFTRPKQQYGRRQTFLRGAIYKHGNTPIPCAVRELRASEAELLVPSSSSLPRRFRLVVEATRFEAECVILRRLGDSVVVGIL